MLGLLPMLHEHREERRVGAFAEERVGRVELGDVSLLEH